MEKRDEHRRTADADLKRKQPSLDIPDDAENAPNPAWFQSCENNISLLSLARNTKTATDHSRAVDFCNGGLCVCVCLCVFQEEAIVFSHCDIYVCIWEIYN